MRSDDKSLESTMTSGWQYRTMTDEDGKNDDCFEPLQLDDDSNLMSLWR